VSRPCAIVESSSTARFVRVERLGELALGAQILRVDRRQLGTLREQPETTRDDRVGFRSQILRVERVEPNVFRKRRDPVRGRLDRLERLIDVVIRGGEAEVERGIGQRHDVAREERLSSLDRPIPALVVVGDAPLLLREAKVVRKTFGETDDEWFRALGVAACRTRRTRCDIPIPHSAVSVAASLSHIVAASSRRRSESSAVAAPSNPWTLTES
jgi:hypothetical protein